MFCNLSNENGRKMEKNTGNSLTNINFNFSLFSRKHIHCCFIQCYVHFKIVSYKNFIYFIGTLRGGLWNELGVERSSYNAEDKLTYYKFQDLSRISSGWQSLN